MTGCQGEFPSLRWPWAWPESWPWAEPTPQAPTHITVSLLGAIGSAAENQHMQDQIASFERATPNIRVAGALVPDYAAALDDAFASGSPPNLFVAWSHQLSTLAAEGHLAPIPADYDRAASLPAHLRPAFQVDGITYCFPRDLSTLALFYNPALFDRVEAAYPTPAWTWNDLVRAAEAVTDINNGIYGLVLAVDASRLLPWLAADDQDQDPWAGADALATISSYVNSYTQTVAVEPVVLDSVWAGEAFGRGRAAMTIEANWVIPFLAQEFPELEYTVLELPSGVATRSTVAFGSCWGVSSQTPNPQAAFQLADFLTTPEANWAWATAAGVLPPSPDQARSWLATHPDYASFVSGLAYALPWSGPAGFPDTINRINGLLSAAIQGEATPEAVIDLLESPAPSALPTPTAEVTGHLPED